MSESSETRAERPDSYENWYPIDSNGNVFDVEILEAEPRGMWESTATKQLRNYQYRAAKNNAQKNPVYVTTRVFFTAEQVDIYR